MLVFDLVVLYHCMLFFFFLSFFFFNDTATTEIYTLSLHDALPISGRRTVTPRAPSPSWSCCQCRRTSTATRDRKSTRLNSSHVAISYAVFCLKKKKTTTNVFYLKKIKKNKQK